MGVIAGYAFLSVGSLLVYFYFQKKKRDWKYKKYLLLLSLVAMVCLGSRVLEQTFYGEGEALQQVQRQEAGLGDLEIQMKLDAEGITEETIYALTVEEQKLTEVQVQTLLEEAAGELERVILGENLSAEEVVSDLQVPQTLMDGKVGVSCYFEPYHLVEADGRILWENLSGNNALVRVMAQLSCQDTEVIHEFYLQLSSRELTEEQKLFMQIKERLAEENMEQGETYLELPKEVNGISLKWYQVRESDHLKILVFGITIMVAWYVCEKEKAERAKKEWNRGLVMDYPNIVSQLSLLTGAGITLLSAWEKMITEYKRERENCRKEIRPGYEEMIKTWNEIQDGTGEIKAYENFGKRCNHPQYRKLASLLTQNIRKGAKGMQQLLDGEAVEAFELRKAYARQMGEEAGTKLLIPMGMMLLLVFAIIMLPAMLSLNI